MTDQPTPTVIRREATRRRRAWKVTAALALCASVLLVCGALAVGAAWQIGDAYRAGHIPAWACLLVAAIVGWGIVEVAWVGIREARNVARPSAGHALAPAADHG